MFIVTGANIFGQWRPSSKGMSIFEKFEALSYNSDCKIDYKQAKLISCCWSYNIFQIDDTFYIAGSWRGKDNQYVRAPKNEEYGKVVNCSEFLIAGNDYNLVFVEKITRTIWFYDLELEVFKKVNFAEEPIQDNTVKKPRMADDIIKIVVTNNTYIYLSSEGNIYTGKLPSYVDTTQCTGKVIDVDCGYEHYMLLTNEGRVYTWGNGRRLQLGHGDLTNMDEPTEVEALSGINITKIKAGGWHSLALSEYGDLYAWGWNDTGQLGMNMNKIDEESSAQKNYTRPTLVNIYDENGVETELNIIEITGGSRHSALLLEDNTVWTAGCNKYGQLGFSPIEFDKLDYFKKALINPNVTSLTAGPWNTIVKLKEI